MTDRASATPLLSLDAIVLDTETTSLDPARARLLEIGAVRLVSGRPDTAAPFHALIDPGESVPSESTRIHGIDAARLKDAPSFAAVWPDFSRFLGDAVVVGHTIHYDILILANEAKRAGVEFSIPRHIDVRLLAQLVKPDLSGFSIEKLAAWLGVGVEHRHSALGDAVTTARIFAALVPHLRERNIRTFAEAETACRELHEAVAAVQFPGGVDPARKEARTDAGAALERLDSYPYRHRVRDVMSKPPLFIAPEAKLAQAMDLLMRERVSSLFVAPDGEDLHRAQETGILTERDVLRAVAKEGAVALERPARDFASRPLAAVDNDAFVYRAIGRMSRLRVRHLGVVDGEGRVVGALSARDLLRLRADEAVALGDEIDEAQDVRALGQAWAKLPLVARGLLAEGVDARGTATVISSELGALTRRAAILGEARMAEAGEGAPPVPYAVLVLGSAGRGESLLAMDQDNAIVFTEGDPDGPEDRWFEGLGTHIADILHEVGVPYCKGGVMAKNAAWRGSARVWRERVAEWIGRSSSQDLLSVDIFFDFRAVHGDGALAGELWRDVFDLAKGELAFLKLLAEAKGESVPPIGFFGIRTENGRVDLKGGGLFHVVAIARILALRFHVAERSTPARLEGVKALGVGGGRDLDTLIEAHATLLAAILGQQLVDIDAGRPPSNSVETRRLSAAQLENLKQALRNLKHVDEMVRDLLTAK